MKISILCLSLLLALTPLTLLAETPVIHLSPIGDGARYSCLLRSPQNLLVSTAKGKIGSVLVFQTELNRIAADIRKVNAAIAPLKDKKEPSAQAKLKILEKQLAADEHEHEAVLQQIAAIRGAVNGLMAAVIEGHLIEHVVKESTEKQRQQDLDVVMQVIKSYLK